MSQQYNQPGMDYDDDSDHEPIQDSDQFKDSHKSCTDIGCCCVWIAALIAFMTVMSYGFANGNPKRLHHGIDNKMRVCGVDAGVEALPFTYFCPPTTWLTGGLSAAGLTLDNPVCVAACPMGPTEALVAPAIVLECGNFSTTAYKTVTQMNYCLPDTSLHKQALGAVTDGISGRVPTIMKAADSVGKGWPLYVVMFFISIVMGYAYICCLKAFAKPLIYLSILVSFAGLAFCGAYMIANAETIGTNELAQGQVGGFATSMAYFIGGCCVLAAVGIACLVCCCFSQIETAVIAVEMTTDVMASIPSLLFAPVVKALVKFHVAMFLMTGFVYLLSVAKPEPVLGSAVARTFAFTDNEYYMIIFYMFMFFWIMSFLTAVYQFAIAYATADYYFAQVDYQGAPGDRNVGCCGVVEGLCVGLMWHQGSFAMGSFIIAIFSMIQCALTYINKTNPNNPLVKCITCVLQCMVSCCKAFAEFVNKNAYIGIAIKGYNFCKACQKAFEIMVKNAAGMAVLNGATFVFQIAGLLLITTSCMFIADVFCQVPHFKDPTNYWFLPNPPVVVFVCGLIAFAMAKIFMDVFDMVADTLMYCFGLEGFNPGSQKVPEPVRNAMGAAQQVPK